MVNFAAHHDASTDPAAQSDIKHWVESDSCPVARFTQRGNVGVIVHEYRRAGQFLQPPTQVEFRPTLNMMRAANPARFPIHRPAKANAYSLRFSIVRQFPQATFDLPPNPKSAVRALDCKVSPFKNRSRSISSNNLQLGPANFDSDQVAHPCPAGVTQSSPARSPPST